MQLEPSKLHQPSEKKYIINMEQAVSRLGGQGTGSMQLQHPTASRAPRRSSPLPQLPPDNCVPQHPCDTQGDCYKGFLSKHTIPKGARTHSIVVGES